MKTTSPKFNILAIPKAKNFLITVLLVATGLGLIFGLPRVIPTRTGSTACPIESVKSPFTPVSHESIAISLRAYELDNELDGGLFRSTANPGDSLPSDEVTSMALVAGRRLSALPYSELFPVSQGENRLEGHINKLLPHALSGELPLHRTYFLLSIAKSLDVPIPAENGVVARIAALASPNGGYLLNEYARYPTIGATYYALKTLELLNQLTSEQIAAEQIAAHIYALQDPATGGFRDSEYTNGAAPTMDDVFRALEVLRLANANMSTPSAQVALVGARMFLAQCRRVDGGFSREIGEDATSKAAPTALGLMAAGFISDNGVPVKKALVSGAFDYMGSCVSNKRGVAETPLSRKTSAEGVFYLTELMARTEVALGRRSWVIATAQWVAALLFAAAAVAWFAPQLDSELVSAGVRSSACLLGSLAVPAALALLFPRASLAVYSAFAAVVLVPAARKAVSQKENEDGEMTVLAMVAGFLFAAFVMAFASKAPYVFAGAGIAGIAGFWAFVAAYVAAYCAGYVLAGKSRKFYNDAAVLAWIVAIVAAALNLFATESPVYGMLVARGIFVPFVVVAPVVLFVFIQLGMAVGSASFSCSPATRQYVKKLLSRFK